MYIELVRNRLSNRPGKCIEVTDLHKHRIKNRGNPLYRSTYLFKQPFQGSVSNYMKDKTIDYIILDIDYSENDNFMDIVKAEIMELKNYLSEYQFIPFFSGTGFHIMFSAAHFGFKPSPNLHNIVKATISRMFNSDVSIYDKASTYRVAHTKNQKSKLYKIPLTEREVFNKSYEEIKELAQTPRFDFDYSVYDLESKEDLTEYKETPNLVSVKQIHEPQRIASCIHNILSRPPKQGQRHITCLRVSSHFRRSGLPSFVAVDTLKYWLQNHDDFTDNEIERIVRTTYNKGYKYGCKDTILAQHCSPHCVYYNKKDYKQAVHTITDMHQQTKQSMETDFSGTTLNIDQMFKWHKDTRVYPGEVVTLIGQTGAGKTAMAQQIVAGIDIYGDQIDSVLPTLYLSMEMSNDLMYRRWWQQLRGVDKSTAKQQIRNADTELIELSHVMIRYISPSLDVLKQEVNQHQPKLLVIDHIELLREGSRDQRVKVNQIMTALRDIAIEHDIIVLAVSQISRAYSRNSTLDVFAGKESGNIENDSSKFLGLWGNRKSKYKKLEFFKNRDGEDLPERYLRMEDSMVFYTDPGNHWETVQNKEQQEKVLNDM